jgi:ATP-dependent DNA ligase
MGLEGIVSKRKDSAYRSGRSADWLKMKNAAAPAVKREEEEEWGKKKRRRPTRTGSMIYGPKTDGAYWI